MSIINMGSGGLNLNYLFEVSDTPPWETTSNFQSPKPILWLNNKLEYLNKYNDKNNYTIPQHTIYGYRQQEAENSEAKPTQNSKSQCNTKLALEPTISLDAEYPKNQFFYQATDTKKPYIQLGFPITEVKTSFTGGFFNSILKNSTADGVKCDYLFKISCQLKTNEQGNLAPEFIVYNGKNLFVLNDNGEVDYKVVTITVSKVNTTFLIVNLDINYEIINGFIKSYVIESDRALGTAEQCRQAIGSTNFPYLGTNLNSAKWVNATKIATTFNGKILENSIIADVANKINLSFIEFGNECTALKITTYDNSEYQLFTFDDESYLKDKDFTNNTTLQLLDLEGTQITLYNNVEHEFNDAHKTIIVIPPHNVYKSINIKTLEDFNTLTETKYIKNNEEYSEITEYDESIVDYYIKQEKQFLGIQYSTNISETIPVIENYSDNYAINAKKLVLKNEYKFYEFNEEEPKDLNNENNKALWIKIGNNSKINIPIINNPLKPHYIEIQSAILKLEGYYYYLNGYVYDNINKIPIPLNTNDYTAVSIKDLIEGDVTEIESDEVTKVTKYMFYEYDSLKSINFINCNELQPHAFGLCKNLTDVYLPEWNSNVQFVTGGTADSSPFHGCAAIQRANIGFLSIAGSTTVADAKSVTPATKAYNPFNSAKRALKQLAMPSCSKIASAAFKGYTVLHDVDIGGDNLEIQDNAFEGCINLKNISLGPSPSKIGKNAFLNCTSLYSVENLEAVQSFATNAFVKCYSLKTDISNPLLAVSFGNTAFNECTNLRYFIAPNCGSIQSTAKTLPFYLCKNLEILSIPNASIVIGVANNVFPRLLTFASFPYLSYCDLAGISKVAAQGFTGLSNLSYIKLSNNYTTIENSTFSNCTCVDPYLANYDLIKDKWEQYEFAYEENENGDYVYGYSQQTTSTDENGETVTTTKWFYRDPNDLISTKIQYETEELNPEDLGTFIESMPIVTNPTTTPVTRPPDETETIDGITYNISYDNIMRKTLTTTEAQTVIKYNPHSIANNENDWLYKYEREKITKRATIEGTKRYFYPINYGPLGGTEFKNEPYSKEDPQNSSIEYFILAENSQKIQVNEFNLEADTPLIAISTNNLIPLITTRKDHIRPFTSLSFKINDNGNSILNYPILYMAIYTNEKLLAKEKDNNGDPILDANGQFIYIAGGYKGLKYINNPDNQDEGLIAPGITTIKTQAFAGCSNLTEVYLNAADGVINANAFQNCINLQEIHAPAFTSVDMTAFTSCNNLKIIELTNVALSNGTKSMTGANILTMFCPWNKDNKTFNQNYTNLQTLELKISTTLPNPAVSGKTYGLGLFENYPLNQAAFINCTTIGSSVFKNTQFSYINANLKQVQGSERPVEYPNESGNIFIPEVTTINNCAFANCSKLQGALLKEVITIGNQAFENCINITQINSDKYGEKEIFNMPNVQTIGEKAFAELTELSLIRLPGTLTSIGVQAFNNCNNLTQLEIQENVNTHLSIGASAFLNNKLTTLKLPFQLFKEDCTADYIAIGADAFKRSEDFSIENELIIDLTNFDRGSSNENISAWDFWTHVNIGENAFGNNVKFKMKDYQYANMPSDCTWNIYYSSVLTPSTIIPA